MIVKETIEIDGIQYHKVCSDSNKYVIKVGTSETYEIAVDPIGSTWEYAESDEEIPTIGMSENIDELVSVEPIDVPE